MRAVVVLQEVASSSSNTWQHGTSTALQGIPGISRTCQAHEVCHACVADLMCLTRAETCKQSFAHGRCAWPGGIAGDTGQPRTMRIHNRIRIYSFDCSCS